MRTLLLLLCISFCLPGLRVSAQDVQDSTSTKNQTVSRVTERPPLTDTVKKKKVFQPNPKKAGLYSALLPGSGQIYNRQYWKVPLVYGAMGAAAYFINFNYKNYNRYRTAYIATIDQDPNTISTEVYSSADLKTLQDQYKQWLDMTVLLTSVGYMLQVMDAVVFAHLKNFDISPDISMRMQPVALPNGGAGFGVAFQLK